MQRVDGALDRRGGQVAKPREVTGGDLDGDPAPIGDVDLASSRPLAHRFRAAEVAHEDVQWEPAASVDVHAVTPRPVPNDIGAREVEGDQRARETSVFRDFDALAARPCAYLVCCPLVVSRGRHVGEPRLNSLLPHTSRVPRACDGR